MKVSDFITKEVFCQSADPKLSKILEDIWELNSIGERRLHSLTSDDLAGNRYGSRMYSDETIAKLARNGTVGNPAKEAQDLVSAFREQIKIALPLIKGETEEVPYKDGNMVLLTHSDGKSYISTRGETSPLGRFLVS